ncbi:hypothetical protein M3Y94_00800000 [Aphelenchoides besseyi]|nr:hypothetical protein M3Y94_00800000 [Aphelenchoides besseyi]KAI6232526.1 Arf-GAP domain-containing protein [Aphelenchoides besseyi]
MRSTSVSAASQRRKLEEQNAQAVRKILAEPHNKVCFECGMRGPTYINLTIGSSCCMHCSGLLRGLNPPHRVKSISMATFTTDEIERLKTLGNAVNTQIWLGLYDGKTKFEPRDDNEIRKYLVDKYENKRWYVSPSDVEQQKRLLEEHANTSQRRSSLSGISHKSNQSAPPNLHFAQQQGKPGPIDLLTGDLFDLSMSSTPTQTPHFQLPTPVSSSQPPKSAVSVDDWTTLFTSTPTQPAHSFPLNPPQQPVALKFPGPSIPTSNKTKNDLDSLFAEPKVNPMPQNTIPQNWESFTTPMPKSATDGGLNAPSNSAFDDFFATEENKPNGQRKARPPLPSTLPIVNQQKEEDPFGSTSFGTNPPNSSINWATQFSSAAPQSSTENNTGNWNPFL